MSTPTTIEFVLPVQQSWNEVLQALDDPKTAAASALRRYLVDVCWQRIEQAERHVVAYERKYSTDFDAFNQNITGDEAYLNQLNKDHPTWEADASEWAYRLEELDTWRKRLERILRESSPSLVQR